MGKLAALMWSIITINDRDVSKLSEAVEKICVISPSVRKKDSESLEANTTNLLTFEDMYLRQTALENSIIVTLSLHTSVSNIFLRASGRIFLLYSYLYQLIFFNIK